MMVFRKLVLVAMSILVTTGMGIARENIGVGLDPGSTPFERLAMNCDDASAQIDLDINNVRAKLLGGGDLWWDLNSAKYEVPKTDAGTGEIGPSSIFAGALWIGGIDAGSQNLKVAAMTYRQSGNDFWPGPIDPVTKSTTQTICNNYDRHWKINRDDVTVFLDQTFPVATTAIPTAILEWPAFGNPYAKGKNGVPIDITKPMAPYVDVDNVLGYDPTQGDYPDFPGDQAIFWIYNDEGNIHTETQGQTIGLEVQALAFAFQTNDQVNDMTFYKYKVINYSSDDLDSVYFGQWVDPDLGWYLDDFVGCDTSRSLGIVYNGDAVDGPNGLNYGANPPILGVDFFQGPTKYTYDGTGAIIDTTELGMSSFVFYNNDFTVTGNPQIAQHYYGYLSGTWKDGTPFTLNGNGYGGSTPFPYMFPDVPGAGGWSECDNGNTPADRRFLQNSGPFLLKPGVTNEVIVGVVWVPGAGQTSCFADFQTLFLADDKAQDLFERDFQIANGPDAPDMVIRELNKELILSIFNDTATSNNANEMYNERIGFIDTSLTKDTSHRFEGYRIFQLASSTVSASQLNYDNPDVAREIYQVDIKNGISKIVNWTFDPSIGAEVASLEVLGSDNGIRHTFQVTEDAFATGEKALINHKTYYFSVVAYAYNNALPYDAADPNTQRTPYFAGRRNIKVYSGIPHITDPELGGTIINTEFGEGVEIIKLAGLGNGGNDLELTEASIATILANGLDPQPTYEANMGPVDVKVYDPYKVGAATYTLELIGTTGTVRSVEPNFDTLDRANTNWLLTRVSDNKTWSSENTIAVANEQLIPELGLSITIEGKNTPGMYKGCIVPDTFFYYLEDNGGLISGTIEFAEPATQWLSGAPDGEQTSVLNWIRAGTFSNPTGAMFDYTDIDEAGDICNSISSRNSDHLGIYEGILGGVIAPYALVHKVDVSGPGVATDELDNMIAVDFGGNNRVRPSLQRLEGIDLVFTPDNSLWTRCAVVEMEERDANTLTGRSKWELRDHPSWALDKSVDETTGLPIYNTGLTPGYSWFPGYAINVETGERLHIIMGENSAYTNDNGDDMVWNPTAVFSTLTGGITLGGMHTVYVVNRQYSLANIDSEIGFYLNGTSNTNTTIYRDLVKDILWAGIPMLANGFSLDPLTDNGGIVPTETRIRLRVTKPYMPVAGANPKYQFSTTDLAVQHNVSDTAVSACDLISVVPNPYYAYSNYEKSRLDNRVRIVNLPAQADIKVYTLDGQLVKNLTRDIVEGTEGTISQGAVVGDDIVNQGTYVEWDLKNNKNIPISSGMYLIHVSSEGLCNKVVKFLAVTRPVDLDTF